MKEIKCNVLTFLMQSLKTKANSFIDIFPLQFLLNPCLDSSATVFKQHIVQEAAAHPFSQITSISTQIPPNHNPKTLHKNKGSLHFNSYTHMKSSISSKFMGFSHGGKQRQEEKPDLLNHSCPPTSAPLLPLWKSAFFTHLEVLKALPQITPQLLHRR